MTLRVLLEPKELSGEGGITTTLRYHLKYYPRYDIQVVTDPAKADLHVIHAGMSSRFHTGLPVCSHVHGLYWTADYPAGEWEMGANANVIATIRQANEVIVPSNWVAEAFKRDMHLSPHVIPHGIEYKEWQHREENGGYILWNKNRASDACDPIHVKRLAELAKEHLFVTTHGNVGDPENVTVTGIMPHDTMRKVVQRAGVYLSTTKETFGIGILEAMASGVPVLGFAFGGNLDLVYHGFTGYLAKVGDYDDLHRGLEYCLKYRKTLGENSRQVAKDFTWDKVAQQLHKVYALTVAPKAHDVSVVIPCYNYGATVNRAVRSALQQTLPPKEIIIVDNNSDLPYEKIDGHKLSFIQNQQEKLGAYLASNKVTVIKFIKEERQGVAHARNSGVRETTSAYVCCLDADDEIRPNFLKVCVDTLKADPTLGVAYTKLEWKNEKEGTGGVSEWPGEYDFDRFIRKQNQVPTCAVFRKDTFRRLGGYRQRYAPDGAGAEDAEFYLRMGAYGWGGKLASTDPLFIYHVGAGNVAGNPNYIEENWLKWHPWVLDHQHPFASPASPKLFSHRVRAYDEPKISVIIPVGPGHEKYLVDALDSLEAQTFRKWEAIVVFDGQKEEDCKELIEAHPFMRPLFIKNQGAGIARNRGVSIARADLLLFLDADDWLEPNALEQMFSVYQESGTIVYSDYIGHSRMEKSEAERLYNEGRLLLYRSKGKMAQIANSTMEFNCELAMQQPELNEQGQFYIWSLVTALVPKAWHNKIKGFDEVMKSWEDWDYHIRLARAGYCYTKIPTMLVNYHFDSGSRREVGKVTSKKLVAHMKEKYERDTNMAGCAGCKGGTSVPSSSPTPTLQANQSLNRGFPDKQTSLVMVQLIDGNIADHHIVVNGTSYGYRSHGDQFLMHREHVGVYADKFVLVEQAPPVVPVIQAEPVSELPPPIQFTVEDDGEEVKSLELDLSSVKSLRPDDLEALRALGVGDLRGVLNLGEPGLKRAKGITAKRAKVILAEVLELLKEGYE